MARLAQSAERKALNLVVVGSSPTVGVLPIPVRRRAFRCVISFAVVHPPTMAFPFRRFVLRGPGEATLVPMFDRCI